MNRPGESKIRLFCAASVLAALAVITLITPPAQAQTYTILHTFSGTPDGSEPMSGLTLDRSGNLYGTTYGGGAYGWGMVFKLAHKSSGWVMEPLYSFPSIYNGGHDGAYPVGPVALAADGSVYGTTSAGSANAGIVFKLAPSASACKAALCPWIETVLYRFTGGADGSEPFSGIVFDQAGDIYGTTLYGGTAGCGVVYELSPSGAGWTQTVLHTFTGQPYGDGCQPYAGLTLDASGNLYGTTQGGGSNNDGTVFQLVPSQSGWTENILHSLNFFSDGSAPYGGVTFDASGNLYGLTPFGGSGGEVGTAFELTPSDGHWSFNLLYNFTGGTNGLPGPLDTPTLDSAGNLLGTTMQLGQFQNCDYGCGNVFKLTPSGGGWLYTSLHDFTGGYGGDQPYGSVALDSAGNIYGTTSIGGPKNEGVVWEITP